MSLWRVEANFDSVSVAFPSPTRQGQFFSAGGGYGITASDATNSIFQIYVCHAMVHDAEINPSSFVPTYHSRAIAGIMPMDTFRTEPPSNLFPLQRNFWSGDNVFDLLDGGAAFTAGGLFAIEKDTVTGDLRFITPMGTFNSSTTDPTLGASLSLTTELRPLSVGLILRFMEFHFPPDHTPDQSIDIRYQNFYGKLDGAQTSGAHVSVADPGIWLAWAESDDFDHHVGLTTTQQTSDYEAQLLMPAQDFVGVPGSSEDAWYRPFDGPDVMPMSTTDMATMHEGGVLWRAAANSDLVLLERSFDGGHSWEMYVVFTDAMATNSSPTVNWYNHRLAVTWYDGTNIKEAHSLNGGATWGMPVTLPFTGTNPRRLTENNGGGSYYFYFDAGPNLLVSITYDNGGSYDGPFTVAAGLTAQQVDADFSPDGSIVASYFVAGVWTQKRSRDLGRTWV